MFCKCGCGKLVSWNYKAGHATKLLWENDKYRNHMKEVHKGYTWTKEQREKILDKLRGKPHSEEHNKKISEARKGIVFSKEHIENLRKSHLGKPGNPHTEESKAKLRVARMKQILPFISKKEIELKQELLEKGLNPLIQYSIGITQADFAFPNKKLAIYIDGCYWHSCPNHFPAPSPKLRQIQGRDKYINEFLKREGWTVLRFWEHEDNLNILNKIMEVL